MLRFHDKPPETRPNNAQKPNLMKARPELLPYLALVKLSSNLSPSSSCTANIIANAPVIGPTLLLNCIVGHTFRDEDFYSIFKDDQRSVK
jgi:hypothetical protein